ncbi:MAG: AAA family ATPase [Bacteroidales bacterium]|nr:AAA family ATPase [Bacteroidales bacterium]
MKNRIQQLLKSLNEGVYEKETEISLALLAALSGQSILLLGPPGVAKSMVARRLKHAFAGARSFEYLMSRFSTPDEIFGPVSIRSLKDDDRYERRTEGYLPSADVAFLDEIWKAGPAIQNTLLTVVNEKTYLNGTTVMHLPLKLLIGASNELPTEGEGLEALWDRFILRLVSHPIRSEQLFRAMLCDTTSDIPAVSESFTADEYADLQKQIATVAVPDGVLSAISDIRRALADVAVPGQDVHRSIYVSDRRWHRIVHLLRTSALLHDRQSVSLSDLQVAVHALWNEPDEQPAVCRIVADALFLPYRQRLDRMSAQIGRAMQHMLVRQAAEMAHSRGDHRDDDLILYDGCYYGIDEKSAAQQAPVTYIYATDFRSMPTHTANEPAIRGVMYTDPQCPRRKVIRAYSNPDMLDVQDVELSRVNLYRDRSALYVNGVRYPLRRGLPGTKLEMPSGLIPVDAQPAMQLEEIEGAVDTLFIEASTLHRQLQGHLFVSSDVAQSVTAYMDSFKKQVAQLRAQVRKLLYGE